jgi:hypothetical protein
VIARRAEIEAADAEVILVAFDETSLLEAKMLRGLEVSFPLLLDAEKSAYAAWGMGRAGWAQAMLSPKLNWRYLKLLLGGAPFLGTAPDMLQLGGDFLLDRQGFIAFEHRMRDSGDRAPVAELFARLLGLC